ncbi:MAG: hypothetical protein IPP77_00165 [Bacteroidetes bacterium]|nr:hypothetical protein [Bacteroidota bacterium]
MDRTILKWILVFTTVNPTLSGTYLYSAVLTDATGCQAGNSIPVRVFPEVVADAGNPTHTICAGESVTLGGSPTASGGSSPFTYSWNNGASPIANPVVNPSGTTAYVVLVTDSNGCTSTASTSVNVNSKPVVNAGLDVVLPACSPTGIQLGGSPTASGGSGGSYTYTWSPSGGLSSTGISNPVVQGLTASDNYTVLVIDGNSCSASDVVSVTLSNSPPLASISASGNTSWCANSGSSVNLTASVSGGNGPFGYNWSGSSITPTNAQVATVNPGTAGSYNYSVTITDASNCTASATQTIRVHNTPLANTHIDTAICSGQSTVLGGSPTASGGTIPYTYSWNNGASSVANPMVSPTAMTAYAVLVTDSNGCTATASTTVNVNNNPIANAGIDVTLPFCSPGGIQIGGSPTASVGSGGSYIYVWSPTGGISSTSISNPIVQGSRLQKPIP